MPYKAEHKEWCEIKNCYAVTREVEIIEDKRGVVINNSDKGVVTSVRCKSCGSPAIWETK